MEPLITVSHYEMPLNLTLKYNGWASRELVDFFVKYCEVLFKRYKGKVTSGSLSTRSTSSSTRASTICMPATRSTTCWRPSIRRPQ